MIFIEKSCLQLLEVSNVQDMQERTEVSEGLKINNESNKTILEVDQVPNGRNFCLYKLEVTRTKTDGSCCLDCVFVDLGAGEMN